MNNEQINRQQLFEENASPTVSSTHNPLENECSESDSEYYSEYSDELSSIIEGESSYEGGSSYEEISSDEEPLTPTAYEISKLNPVPYWGKKSTKEVPVERSAHFSETSFIGRGAFSEVFLAETLEKPNKTSPKNRKAFKVFIKPQDPKKLQELRKRVKNEYNLMQQAPYLGAKPPRELEDIILLPMTYFPGDELLTVISEYYEGEIRQYNDKDLLKISQILIDSYYKQIFLNRLIHRDIKLENVKLDDKAMGLNFLDLGLALKIGEKDARKVGNYNYLAPEVLDPSQSEDEDNVYTTYCDIYALGKILFRLWTLYFKDDERITQHCEDITYENCLEKAFHFSNEIAKAEFSERYSFMKELIVNMVQYERKNRWGIERVRAYFNQHYKPFPSLSVSSIESDNNPAPADDSKKMSKSKGFEGITESFSKQLAQMMLNDQEFQEEDTSSSIACSSTTVCMSPTINQYSRFFAVRAGWSETSAEMLRQSEENEFKNNDNTSLQRSNSGFSRSNGLFNLNIKCSNSDEELEVSKKTHRFK